MSEWYTVKYNMAALSIAYNLIKNHLFYQSFLSRRRLRQVSVIDMYFNCTLHESHCRVLLVNASYLYLLQCLTLHRHEVFVPLLVTCFRNPAERLWNFLYSFCQLFIRIWKRVNRGKILRKRYIWECYKTLCSPFNFNVCLTILTTTLHEYPHVFLRAWPFASLLCTCAVASLTGRYSKFPSCSNVAINVYRKTMNFVGH